jgi:prepilin-type N-terminal cleavage/methylation domain-containing protein/prepilin-type processing-associated H-X9-DG protein
MQKEHPFHRMTPPMPANHHTTSRPTTKAFTLPEMLVVIAIIAVLAAFTMTLYGKLMSSARNTQCVSNLKTHGIAINSYAADNNNQFPPFSPTQSPAWYQYLGSQFGDGDSNLESWMPENLLCPEIRKQMASKGYVNLANSYWMNFGNTVNRNNTSRRIGWMSKRGPEQCVLLADANPANFHEMTKSSAYFGSYGGYNKTDIGAVHGANANLLFFDGHVQSMSVAEIQDRDKWFKMMNTSYNGPWGEWYEP